jgi:outer membrane protein assembly factor BamB
MTGQPTIRPLPIPTGTAAGFLALALAVTAPAQDSVGWSRDGSGDFPTARPPPAFDGEQGTGVRFKASLPNWSNSSPLVVETAKGPRVLLLSEPVDYVPILLCLDADTGTEVWRVELDAVAHLPASEQEAARTLAKRGWAGARLRKTLTVEIQNLYEKDKDNPAWKDRAHPPAAVADLLAKAKAAGLEYRGIGQSAGGYANHLDPVRNGPWDQDHRKLTALGLMWSNWDYQGTWDGVAYPTPISDGAKVWTVTSHNLYSCHDLDGKQLWQVRFAPSRVSDLTPEQQKEVTGADGKSRWPGIWPGQGGFSTSPIMAEGKLVSCAGRMVRCLDARTGVVLWSHPMRGEIGQALGVPAFVIVDGERYVIGVGNEGASAAESAIYRLSDGAVVARLPGVTSSKGGVSGPVVWNDGILNRPGHDDAVLAFHRLVKKGESLELEKVWSLPRSAKREEAISLFRPARREGRLYNGGAVLDLKEGKWLATQRGPVNPGYYGQGCILIGPALLHWNFYGDGKSNDKSLRPQQSHFVWTDAATGKPMGEGQLPINPADGKPLDLKRGEASLNHWRWLTAATPFAWKDRLYVRAYDFLWCLGPK